MKCLKLLPLFMLLAAMLIFSSCHTIPEGANAVIPFNKQKYLGKWYEIARLDYKQEKNLNNTTAEYSMNNDGTIKVFNRGYNVVTDKWEEAIGKAKFVKNEDIGMLKVSFFGPFYSGYNVIAIDPDYKYALVAGESLEYLWILSREQTIPGDVKENYLTKAQKIGYNTSDLLWVEHNKTIKP